MSDVIPAVLSTVPSVADDLGMWLTLNHIGAMKFVDGGFFFFFFKAISTACGNSQARE